MVLHTLDPTSETNNAVPSINRDLSWIQFNDRVLDESFDEKNPLFERLKFLSISASNFDEFYMIRVASTLKALQTAKKKSEASRESSKIDELTKIHWDLIQSTNQSLLKQIDSFDLLKNRLNKYKIHLLATRFINDDSRNLAKRIFEESIFPLLEAPEVLGPGQAPSLENLQLGAFFEPGFLFKIPKKLKSVFTAVSSEKKEVHLFFLDLLLEEFLGPAFGFTDRPLLIRLTRDADLSVDLEGDTESIPDLLKTNVSSREKGTPVRLQYRDQINLNRLTVILNSLKFQKEDSFVAPRTLCLHGLWSAISKFSVDDLSVLNELVCDQKLEHPPIDQKLPQYFETHDSVFELLSKQDFLLHHPYDSFDAYVRFIQSACDDPNVTSIEQTVYRMDALSPVIELLKKAASHKKVKVVIELRARFDELNNLRLADEFRRAGVEVYFGFGKLKIHAKLALITRVESDGQIRLYSHLSTGNYHSVTARQYTDMAVLTSNQTIGKDVRNFFDSVYQGKVPIAFHSLVSAPAQLHKRMLSLIRNEIDAATKGKSARIFAKVNALVDLQLINTLYDASRAGVKIDLLVRGACSLIPGIQGVSDNIRVRSIVDRYLEHSRIYYFENSNQMYLSSADWMPRNFFSRLEIAFPIKDERIFKYLKDVVIPTYLADNVKLSELDSSGVWNKIVPGENDSPLRSQFFFEALSKINYKGTPLE